MSYNAWVAFTSTWVAKWKIRVTVYWIVNTIIDKY